MIQSHTVIVGEDHRARQTENRLNAVMRHCKIGKVTLKTTAKIPVRLVPQPLKPIWPFSDTEWKQTYMDKCGCRVGSACGNVACPHRLIATC
jgi:hypothetical protein